MMENQKYYAGNAIGQAETCRREGEVRIQLNRLISSVERLTDALRDLGMKMAPVMRSEPLNEKERLSIPSPNVPLASELHSVSYQIDELVMQVRQQIELTEL